MEVWSHYEIVDGRKRDWLEFRAYGFKSYPQPVVYGDDDDDDVVLGPA